MTTEQQEALDTARQDMRAELRRRGQPGVPDDLLVLYRPLLRMVRQNAQRVPIGHDAIVDARQALALASGRKGQAIDWAGEKMP